MPSFVFIRVSYLVIFGQCYLVTVRVPRELTQARYITYTKRQHCYVLVSSDPLILTSLKTQHEIIKADVLYHHDDIVMGFDAFGTS